ncbi:hypothetical protein LWI28_025871 [Acer negundo]|uniref:Ubiquitin-like protease family profile domain-containing protein n=1 Tax=Acer negundo TaxID=4023 RepID=A0AAD5NKH9_ACENE|nr:hypothetical protein LWI28_025871 [Acer negundo]
MRQGKNMYHHRISRRGYANLEVELGTKKKPQSAEECLSPPLVNSLIGYANRLIDENGVIEIHMEAGIIDNGYGCFYLMGDDILQFCEMEEISVIAMLTYMRLLYEELKNCNMDDMYRFVEPSTLYEETGYKNDHRAHELLSRMMVVGPHQLLLLPFNAGNHWMLVIMDPHDFMVYFLDSLGNKPCQNLKNFISLAFTMFAEKIGKKDTKCITWRMIRDELIDKRKGALSTFGSQDVLTMALETPEHIEEDPRLLDQEQISSNKKKNKIQEQISSNNNKKKISLVKKKKKKLDPIADLHLKSKEEEDRSKRESTSHLLWHEEEEEEDLKAYPRLKSDRCHTSFGLREADPAVLS